MGLLNKPGQHIIGLLCFLALALYSCSEKSTGDQPVNKDQKARVSLPIDSLLYFKNFDTKDGLISSDLDNTYADSHGYIWISSAKGVMRFDGQNFKPFFDNLETGVRLEGPNYFFEDHNGTFWIFSGSGYLNKYNPQKDIMEAVSTQLENGWANERPMNVALSENGTLWLGGYGGIQKLDTQTGEIKLFPIQKIRTKDWPHKEKVRMEIIRKDKKGQIWLGSRKFGLIRFDPSKGSFDFLRDRPEFLNYLLDDWITDIEVDDDQTFWISDFERGLVHFDPENEQIIDFFEIEKLINSSYKVAIRDLFREGNFLWMATNYHGLLLFDLRKKKIIKQFTRENSSIGMNKITSVHRDRQGNYWLTGNQLVAASSTFYEFKNFAFGENLAVYDLAEGPEGVLATTQKGIFQYSPQDKIKEVSPDQGAYYAIKKTKNKHIWAGGSSRSIELTPDLSKIVKEYSYGIPVDSVGNSLRRSLSLMEDSQGTIWQIDNWRRLHFIKPETGETGNIFSLAQDPISKKFIQVMCLLDDPGQKRILVGTDLGLATVSYKNYELKWIADSKQQQEKVSYLYRGKNGNLWGIFSNKIFRMDKGNLSLSPLTFEDRKSDENFNWIVEEPANTFWIQSSNGILRYKDNKTTLYANHNFSEGSFAKPAPVLTSNGKVFFGGESGLSVIDPELYKNNEISPQAQLQYVNFPAKRAENQTFDSTLYTTQLNSIELKHDQNRLKLKFDALHYKEPALNKFKYKLEGYDDNFLNSGSSGEIFYTNLSPGNYTLQYAAANGDGVWSDLKEFNIMISPPWYQTWWAWLLYLGLFFLAIYGWIRYRVFMKLERYRATEEMRTNISADLHDDVGSLLAGLSMKSELMSLGVKPVDVESLNKISEMARDAMERMRDTVWAIDSRKDKVENLLDRMRAFAEQNLPEKGFRYEFTTEGIDKASFINPILRQNLYLILKEAVTNILKHSDGNTVEIKLKKSDSNVQLEIKDNGQQKYTTPSDGLGMSNMKNRAAKINGSVRSFYKNGFTLEVVAALERTD